ncbi:hypothetical protein AMTRI_Chr06g171520 [Amborella trichopoda]
MDGFIQSTLIDIYANAGCLDYSRQVFDESSQFNVVCCTAMINGYIRFGSLDKSGQLFNEMVERDVISWSAMISAVLPMSSSLHSHCLDRWVHTYMIKSRVSGNVELSTSVVDMYSKCGALEMGLKLFRKIPTKDVGSWNAMISGLAMHGSSFMRYRERGVWEVERERELSRESGLETMFFLNLFG